MGSACGSGRRRRCRASRPRVVLCCPVILVATRLRKFAEGDDDMAFQARVYLQRPHETSSTPIGKILVEILPPGSPLRLHCQIKFTYEGKVEIGRVDGIVPEKWKSSDHAPPMLYVVVVM